MIIPRTPWSASLVSIADHSGDDLHPRSIEKLYRAADALDALSNAIDTIERTFSADEAQGRYTKDKTFALEIIREAKSRATGVSA